MAKYPEHKELNLPKIASDMLKHWKENEIFEQSVSIREGKPAFTFYEGPPSANGTPGIHHVMARTIKDIFCRYKTLRGFQVKRKGGWDTHGLPVELQVEKLLGITKDDIGTKISIADYNKKCRETVMMYKDQWDDLTEKMGYWVDLKDPYITYDSKYIESIWWLLKQLYEKQLLYKGYTIQPFSPAAGTGLSSHELNLPGCYKDVKDTSIVAQFKVIRDAKFKALFERDGGSPFGGQGVEREIFILAWTTTPWTLPSNTALVVGEKIKYIQVDTFNPYTFKPVSLVLAKDLVGKYFSEKNKDLKLADYKAGDKAIPFEIVNEFSGKDLIGLRYEQLIPYLQPLYDADKAFQVVAGDFVTTEDGTGVVHASPTFGADDFRVAKQFGIPPLTLKDETGNEVPTVDKHGRFVNVIGKKLMEGVKQFNIKTHKPLGEEDFYVKNYTNEDEAHPDYKNTDVIISIILKEESKAFKVEKYEHSYPHCWRTDKPVLYYPLDSWFIRTTALKDRMVELNKTINWKPESTGTGRFGNWLENLVDWNLSRSRFWGTPLPIWRTKDGKEEICIGSVEELKAEVDMAIAAGIKQSTVDSQQSTLDLHRPYVDEIILVSKSGQPMYREPDLIDVWFDSGAMPYAQHHFPAHNPLTPEGGTATAHALSKNGGSHPHSSNSNKNEINLENSNPPPSGVGGSTPPSGVGGFSPSSGAGGSTPNWLTANPLLYKLLKEYPKKNRNNPTPAEEKLWVELSSKKLDGFKFRRQHIIDDVIVDFVCLKKRLVIEVDGAYHETPEQQQYDVARTQLLEHHGFSVIRFTNDEVLHNLPKVLEKIHVALCQLPTLPTPPLGVGGSVGSSPFGGQGVQRGFPADYISEGVDQTRGWFFTLHAIATLVFDSVAFKNVISTGLVLDKNGNKMSKRLGNTVNPFEAMEKYGSDALRWYMVENAPPWDNLKFNFDGVTEAQRRFFGTLFNTYSFFSLYANIDGFVKDEMNVLPASKLSLLDRWIISKLQALIVEVTTAYDDYEPTKASRAIQDFVNDHLSNWYVRLNRKRFWEPSQRGALSENKIAAYETLYECLMVVSQLMSPIAPFFADYLYKSLTDNIRHNAIKNNTPLRVASVHHSDWVVPEANRTDAELEKSMDYAQKICSLVHSIRKASKVKVRTPLSRILLPVLDEKFAARIKTTESIIKSEVNVKTIEYIDDASGLLVKKVKPNFARLGKQYGPKMKEVAAIITAFTAEDIKTIEKAGTLTKGDFNLSVEDVVISSEDIPGWSVATDGGVTVALDITVTEALKREGIARDFVNRIQNLRKDMGLEVLDKISIEIEQQAQANGHLSAIQEYKAFIGTETQAISITFKTGIDQPTALDMDEVELQVKVTVNK